MDEQLARMRREVNANPANVELARRYDQALVRAGLADAVEERYRAKYVCANARFEELELTDDPDVRFCGDCKREVRYVGLETEVHAAVNEGRCVAVHDGVSGGVIEILAGIDRTHTASEASAMCVVLADRRVDLLSYRGFVLPLWSDELRRKSREEEAAKEAREEERRAFWAAARGRVEAARADGREAYLIRDVLEDVPRLLDDPDQPGAWTARLEVDHELELEGLWTVLNQKDDRIFPGAVRRGLLRLVPHSTPTPSWAAGGVVVRVRRE